MDNILDGASAPSASDSPFDSTLNVDYHQKYNQQSDIASTVVGGAVASVADFGASIWNSLPGTDYVGTEDLLARIDPNALQVYNEHPDAIHAASFIGGMLIPSSLAMKGMGMARAGVKGVNWFSEAGKAADLKKIDDLFRAGQAATPAYRAAKTELFAKGLANQALDAAAMEFAIVGTMHAHPLLEDYMKDPVKNFATSVALGGVIGGAIGHISDAYQIGKIEKAAEGGIVNFLQKDLKPVAEGELLAGQVQTHQANIDTLESILSQKKATGLTDTNSLEIQVAEKYLLSTKTAQDQALTQMIGPKLGEAITKDKDLKNTLLDMITKNGFNGVEQVEFIKTPLGGNGNVLKLQAGNDSFLENLVFAPKTKKFTNPDTGEVSKVPTTVDVAYSPEFGRFYSLKDVKHYARARDLGLSAEALSKELPSIHIPNRDIAEEMLSANSATVDAAWLGELHRIDKMSVDEVKSIVLASDDLPRRNALLARIGKDPDAFAGHEWTVTNNKPNYEKFNQEIIKGQAAKGIKATHLEDNFKFTNPTEMMKYDLLGGNSSLTSEARSIMASWMGGTKGRLANAMEAFRTGKTDADGMLGAEIYNSTESKALRAEFAKNADSEGNVYLYRGMRAGKNVGHGALDSYTTDPVKAAEFLGRDSNGRKTVGAVRLYKVNVDDIVGGIKDISEVGSHRKNEIIVRARTLDAYDTLPASIEGVSAPQIQSVAKSMATGVEMHDSTAILNQLIEGKDSTISNLLAQGIPLETIAIRTNTPLDTVKAFSLSNQGISVADLSAAGLGFREYDSASKIGDYLATSQRTLRLAGNANKNIWATFSSGLDITLRQAMQTEVTSAALASSKSTIVKDLGNYFFADDKAPILGLLRAKIGEFVNGGTGSRFITSADFNVRNMGDVGPIVTTIGKDMTHKTNAAMKSMLEPLNNLYSNLAKDAVAQIEYSTAINVNASIKGWRTFENGQFFTRRFAKDSNGVIQEILEPVMWQGKEFKTVSPVVESIFSQHASMGREMFEMKNSINKVLGKKPMNDIGLWIPSFNPVGKFLAYEHDAITETTKVILANTAEDLEAAVLAVKSSIKNRGLEGKSYVVTKGDQGEWNRIHGRLDPMTMEVADIGMQKTGSSSASVVKANLDLLGEIAGGYEHYIGAHMRQIAELSMADIMDGLNRMSQYNTRLYEGQTLSPITQMAKQPKDTANVIRNTLLGNSNLSEYQSWRHINQSFETGLSIAMGKVGQIFNEAVRPLLPSKSFFGKAKEIDPSDLSKLNYEEISKKLKEAGAVNPWAVFDDEAAKMFGLAQLTDSKDTSKRIIYAGNALAATVALRVGELAQPICNAMSLPILTSLAVSQKMPETFMGIQHSTAKVGGVQVMMEGVRAMHDVRFDSLRKRWEAAGYFEPHVSESNNTLKLARTFDRGAITKVENALDSALVKILSKPADWSESLVRSQTMHTGAVLAKRLYPELDDAGVTIFARDFMDKAVGNYHASQRPVFFQGTMGVALGLFQTYILTLGQNIYRHLELKNYKALGKAALAQETIFGASSMPGFHQVSEMIGTHFSDNNVDLTTGTYRALPDTAADMVLYGLPSNLGPALYTRGEISPRVPNVLGGLQNVVAVNFVKQTYDMLNHVAEATGAQDKNMGQALGEAISLQSMSRPVARLAELGTRNSITTKGNTVTEDTWTPIGVMARILGTRPTQEAKLREAIHLNTFYGGVDHDARQHATKELKTAIRAGNLSDELIGKLAEEYMRKGGTAQGWRSTLNTSLAQTTVNGKQALADKLRPDSPLNFMIDSLD